MHNVSILLQITCISKFFSSVYFSFDVQSNVGCFSEDLHALGPMLPIAFPCLVFALVSAASDIAFITAFASSMAAWVITCGLANFHFSFLLQKYLLEYFPISYF